MAELAGLENQIAPFGASQSSIQTALAQNGPTGFTVLAIGNGTQSVGALASPEAFDFSSWGFGSATIAGFDPTQDAVRLSHTLVSSFATVQSDMVSTAGGAVITFDGSHSLTLGNVAPASLVGANFRFV
jgi:hypothetical protein